MASVRTAATRVGPTRVRDVWLVNHYADAPDQANGTRHFDLGRRIVGRGDRVTIFASGFSHVTGRRQRLGRWQLYRTQAFEGVRFVWLRTTPYRGNGARRQINMLSFALVFLVVQSRLSRPDAIVGSTVHPFAAFAAWLASRLRRASFLYEIRDLWPQTLVDMGALRLGSPGERLLRWIEAFLVRRAVVVITLLPGVQRYLIERGLPADHVLYIPNGVDLEAFDRAASLPIAGTGSSAAVRCMAAIDAMRAEGRLVFAYVGAFGLVNGLSTIAEAARIAEARSPGSIGVLLIGDGPERERIAAEIAGLEAVRLCAPVPKAEIPTIMSAIDVGIVHATSTPTYRFGISFNKLFEYIAAGRPVVFACTSGNDPVAATHAGVSIPPLDAGRMADAFLGLVASTPVERRAMGEAGRAYVAEGHDIERLASMLAGPDGLGKATISARGNRTGPPGD